MAKDELKKYFDILELPADASLREIHKSFLRLKKIYSNESIAVTPLGEEFSEKRRKKILEDVEAAYVKLIAAKKDESSRTAFLPVEEPEFTPDQERILDPTYSGPSLRKIREKAGIELSEISKELKLRVDLLKSLEAEKFEALPEAIYLKVHLKNYAAMLGLDPIRVAEEYLRRHKAWKENSAPPEK
jgi:hypothetical protein